MRTVCIAIILTLLHAAEAAAQQADDASGRQFTRFVRARGDELIQLQSVPASLDEWKQRRDQIRQRLLAAWGGFPEQPCPLEPMKLGELQRPGYRVEKIVFQTRPGIWMTANAYVPDRQGKVPAVLCVHGHWRGAKQDPVVQARCIGLVKHGFFVLVVDAFGAGERAVGKALGEYHGEMTGATLLPVGLPLAGLQVYENMRAVDYLCSRPEVDPTRIGITGASGGGNQSELAGAWDERFAAVVPVCSVGSGRAFLQVAACMCEIVPGHFRFADEWTLLALAAPRGLLVINATRDGIQFSDTEAKKSLAVVKPVFGLYGHAQHVRHAVFESGHDYNREMREAMYGWMTWHLKTEGDGSPLAEPPIATEDPELLRCYPGDARPDDFVTIPQFAAQQARRILSEKYIADNAAQWHKQAARMRVALQQSVFGGDLPTGALDVRATHAGRDTARNVTFSPEPGITLTAHQEIAGPDAHLAIVLHLGGAERAAADAIAAALRQSGGSLVTLDLRATGRLAYDRDQIGRAPDHNTAEWALLLGRPLLGQWVADVRRCLDAFRELDGRLADDVALVGLGPAGVVALCTAALDARVNRVATVGTLAGYVTDVPYEGQRLGIMAPGIVRDVGDVAHLAALVAPRRVVIANSVSGAGKTLAAQEVERLYEPARHLETVLGTDGQLIILRSDDPREIVAGLLH